MALVRMFCPLLAGTILLAGASLIGCKRRTPPSTVSDIKSPEGAIDYKKMDALKGLETKYQMMQSKARGNIEREILRVTFEAFKWGRQNGKWPDVNMEDLMAHARQESNIIIERLEKGLEIKSHGGIGNGLWDYHSPPSADLTGAISYSVWQAVEVEYLLSGRHYDAELAKLYDEYIVKYAFEGNPNPDEKTRLNAPWSYKKKILEKEGKEKGQAIIDALFNRITKIVSADPTLHVKITADLLQEHYKHHGAHGPNSIRSYFLLSIQKNLKPENWLEPVRFKDDIPPSAKNNYKDNNAHKRGDYGKQVMMGNTYNDRGMIYWYAVTLDEATIGEIIKLWAKDPARLRKGDYQYLYDKGYLKYAKTQPEIFKYVINLLPD